MCDDFGSKFEASYSNLPFLGAKIVIPSLSVPAISIPAISVPDAHFSVSKDYVKEQVKGSLDALKAGSGIVVAAIFIHFGLAGLMIILIIGAIIIGTKIYIGSLSNSQEERGEQFRSSVNRDIDYFFAEYNKQIIINLARIYNEILSQLKNSVSTHISEYYSKVNKLIEVHKKEENRLKKEIDQINSDIYELSVRNKKLDDLKNTLLKQEN
jgi:hypothetical protein